MTLLRKRITVRANGKPRSLMLIEETAKGDVYLKLRSGAQVGIPPNEKKIREDRYSVHVSERSPDYSTIKNTITFKSGEQATSAALTDAVKSRRGFTNVVTIRFSNLSNPIYDFAGNNGNVLCLGDFDPEQSALVLGIFVGHPLVSFPESTAEVLVKPICTTNFQIVLCWHWLTLPATDFAWKMHRITFPPEASYEEAVREHLRSMLVETHDSRDALDFFKSLSTELLVNLLQTYQMLADDPVATSNIQSIIDSLPRVPSIRM